MNKITLKQYSKLYFKALSDSSFKKEINESTSKRIKAYLPLYSAINKNYGFIDNPFLLEKVAYYLKMINSKIEKNGIYEKFMNSFKRHLQMEKQNCELKIKLQKEIYVILNKYSISSYKLIKIFKVNPKIANELINHKAATMSLEKIIELKNKLKK